MIFAELEGRKRSERESSLFVLTTGSCTPIPLDETTPSALYALSLQTEEIFPLPQIRCAKFLLSAREIPSPGARNLFYGAKSYYFSHRFSSFPPSPSLIHLLPSLSPPSLVRAAATAHSTSATCVVVSHHRSLSPWRLFPSAETAHLYDASCAPPLLPNQRGLVNPWQQQHSTQELHHRESNRKPHQDQTTSAQHGCLRCSFFPNFAPHVFQSSDPNATRAAILEERGFGPHPAGGFLGYFQDSSNYTLPEEIRHQPPMSSNFTYSGGPTPYFPFQAPQTPVAQDNKMQFVSESGNENSTASLHTSPTLNDDNNDENGGSRTGRRMIWTPDESMRLVSAWLKSSIDPIGSNYKRNEEYWTAVTDTFNSTTPSNRKRGVKQLKEQWHRVNKSVHFFNSSWMKAERLRGSGESNEQVMDNAHAFYENDFSKEGPFKLKACWDVLKEQPKWYTYNEDLNGSNKRNNSRTQEVEDLTSSPDVISDLLRPGGAKKAKAERNKGKGNPSSSTMEEIDKLREVQVKSKEDRIEVLERHQTIVSQKKESARLSFLAAQENKEAKLLEKEGKMYDKETKMLETYKFLLTFDTIGMPEDMRAEHVLAIKSMRERIFGNRT